MTNVQPKNVEREFRICGIRRVEDVPPAWEESSA
ncbi:hypothetical protein TcasGA2_TC013468 [Tribolium castaneum]|uniref:Uncharacterized protein n=1 Tax=Tribolium castaneum TaxID=7070 RepID=D6WLC3_TRICA|nr:hypothetical protein TcasGA2_TC013468 [Tribolium castaneum]